jgi:hypothetical protein
MAKPAVFPEAVTDELMATVLVVVPPKVRMVLLDQVMGEFTTTFPAS